MEDVIHYGGEIYVELAGSLTSTQTGFRRWENTLFWKDLWIGEQPLYIRFPRLCCVVNDKSISMADKWSWQVGSCVFSWSLNNILNNV